VHNLSATERALQMAKSGTEQSVEDIRRTLKKEGCDGVEAYLSSESFRKQLKTAIGERLGKAPI
jgi:Fe-S cluster assembly iron-binding protein IscA